MSKIDPRFAERIGAEYAPFPLAAPHYAELQAEWTAHYLEDDRIRLTENAQRELFAAAGCKPSQMHQRWCMDAVFSGVRS